MKFIKPLAALLFAASLSFTLTYCSTPPANNGGGDAGAADTGDNSCVTDSDCGDPKVFLCDAVSGKCQPACTKKEDCGAHPFANGGALEGCGAGLGCNCDERKCVPQACTDDIECGAQICKSGKCQAADATAASCAIAPTYQVMRVGQTATFTATAYDAAKAPINAGKTAITWSAADGSVTSTGNGVFTGKAAGTAATLGVKATVAGKDCFAKVLVVGDAPTGGARVIAVDELTGRPITGATVVYETSTMTEDASIKGSYTLGTAAAGAATVSVFHPDFQYVTLVGVTKKDLYIPVRRNAGQKAGGYKGKYTNL